MFYVFKTNIIKQPEVNQQQHTLWLVTGPKEHVYNYNSINGNSDMIPQVDFVVFDEF